jgi:hypothetical protein
MPPSDAIGEEVDELLLSEYDRHMYVAKLHQHWARESRSVHFHDTAELHSMASRNHFEWANMVEQDTDDGRQTGLFREAMGYRREAVNAERWAKKAERNGDEERAWKEREEGRVAGYKAAKAEDERH